MTTQPAQSQADNPLSPGSQKSADAGGLHGPDRVNSTG